ncbi:MAG: pilin [Patescibacteria group bacterium]|nr:pilin [Patescibacteria group bacterium]
MKKKLFGLSGLMLADAPGNPTDPPTIKPPTGSLVSVETLTSTIIGIVLYLIGAVAIISLIYGGFLYMTAGGDAEKTTKARNVILYAILGVVVVAASFLIVGWITGDVIRILKLGS